MKPIDTTLVIPDFTLVFSTGACDKIPHDETKAAVLCHRNRTGGEELSTEDQRRSTLIEGSGIIDTLFTSLKGIKFVIRTCRAEQSTTIFLVSEVLQ